MGRRFIPKPAAKKLEQMRHFAQYGFEPVLTEVAEEGPTAVKGKFWWKLGCTHCGRAYTWHAAQAMLKHWIGHEHGIELKRAAT